MIFMRPWRTLTEVIAIAVARGDKQGQWVRKRAGI
jgi:hypothetical protein